jgi:hypothetical protein
MRLHLPAALALAALAACSGADTTRPGSTPTFMISDGAHQQAFNDPNANPDFFFLPPMVNDPSGSPNFNAGDFNPNLVPTVTVCALALPATATESDVLFGTPCAPGGYTTSFGAVVNTTQEQYQANWTVPSSDTVFYRIRVLVGDVSLGFADVESVPNPQQLQSVDKTRFVGQQDGSNIPIKFRIEIGALCTPAGTRPCNSATFELANGGTVNFSTDGGSTLSGVNLPGQSSQAGNHTFTLQKCDNLNPRAIDLPTFGSCVTVKSTPVLSGPLDTPAIVQVCDLVPSISAAGLTEAQEKLITLHRLDGAVVHALPHASGCAILTGATTPSFKDVLAELGRGHLKGAVGELAAMLAPTPLNARRRRIDQGGGGGSTEFSDFQFALPAKMDVYQGNGQTAPYSSTLPTNPGVIVTDLDGSPVANATVHFAAQQGSVGSASAVTGPDGIATTSWTLAVPLGAQSMTASGRGIAGANFDGPRCSFDPFQSIQLAPHPADFGQGPCAPDGPVETPVLLKEGNRVFGASAIVPFGAGGYSYKVVNSNTTSPSGWQLASFIEAANGFTAGATAPFASTGRPCFYVPATTWTAKTDILIRRTFTLGAAAGIQARVAVDNDVVEIYLNGVAMTGGPTSHTGCAVPNAADNSFFTGAGVAGTNLLTIRAHDQGGTASFLDVRVSVP